MYEKPSQWLKRAQQRETETPEESLETVEIESTDEEPFRPDTHAEYQNYRGQMKHMIEKILAAQKGDRPSPDEELGEERA
jgi:hypothetical protein